MQKMNVFYIHRSINASFRKLINDWKLLAVEVNSVNLKTYNVIELINCDEYRSLLESLLQDKEILYIEYTNFGSTIKTVYYFKDSFCFKYQLGT